GPHASVRERPEPPCETFSKTEYADRRRRRGTGLRTCERREREHEERDGQPVGATIGAAQRVRAVAMRANDCAAERVLTRLRRREHRRVLTFGMQWSLEKSARNGADVTRAGGVPYVSAPPHHE